MLGILLSIALTAAACATLNRHYAIVTLKYKQATRVKDGWLRDTKNGLELATIHYDGCEYEIRLSTGSYQLASISSHVPYQLSGLLHAVSLPTRQSVHSRYLMRRSRYNTLMQYASGRKKLARTGVACC